MKLTIVGPGHVGGQAAFTCALGGQLSEIVLIDVQAGLARGKALDIRHALPMAGNGTQLRGSGRLDMLVDSDIVAVTAGFARRPGTPRHDLLRQNAGVVANIAAFMRPWQAGGTDAVATIRRADVRHPVPA